ncbi:TetR family transcriptional regulator [Frondihabitans sucicola]|uniref:TetR family transcriptional regulator n=1 Tax=Frondihabitans sucicola TaxID=1268041 RepID=A0ABN6Y172_9MICO|nr:TetR/AcrR family transcriptional regulator [Frondihabitans sucicola]BDZ49726.1 TetR family transcriptional regulator [Frondihabitans sucicola]
MRADAEANLARIIDAARSTFARDGLQVSIEVVAENAGVGLGTIYRRFENKEALVLELVRRLLSEVIAIAQRHEQDPDGRGLFDYFDEVGRVLQANRGTLSRIWSSPATTSLVASSRLSQARLLMAAISAETVRPDLTPEDIAVALWSIAGVIDVAGVDDDIAWRRHTEFLLAGFTNQAAVVKSRPLRSRELEDIIRESPLPSSDR